MGPVHVWSEFDCDDIVFGKTATNPAGGQMVWVNDKTGGPVLIQAPRMKLPFGISKMTDDKAKDNAQATKYSVNASFTAGNPDIQQFKELIQSMDDKLIKEAKQKSAEWFDGKVYKEDMLREFMTPSIKVAKDKNTKKPTDKYAPTIKYKLSKRDDKFTFKLWDSDENKLEPEDVMEHVPKRSEAIILFKVSPVWFINKRQFGLSYEVHQMQVFPDPMAESAGFMIKRQVVDQQDDDMVEADDEEDTEEVDDEEFAE